MLTFIFKERSIRFLRYAWVALGLSLVLMLGSATLVATKGINFGVDFTGGVVSQLRLPEPTPIAEVRDRLEQAGLQRATVQRFGSDVDVLVQSEALAGEDAEASAARVRGAIEQGLEGAEVRQIDVVGPKVSDELFRGAALALGIALVAIVIYIWFRFEWQFSLGAVAALFHDIVLTIGVFSLIGLEFNLPIVAALLTIIGYSLNDTVVVYDRVREKLRKYKTMPLDDLLNLAINKTLARTLMTSITTLIALTSLYVLGGPVLRGFTFAMIWGVVVGTYSSIFVAAPLLNMMGITREAPADVTT
jgi:preprotein translocase subunit SecF